MATKQYVDLNTKVIEMRNIVKKFGKFTANDGINLTVHKGEIHAILGEKSRICRNAVVGGAFGPKDKKKISVTSKGSVVDTGSPLVVLA